MTLIAQSSGLAIALSLMPIVEKSANLAVAPFSMTLVEKKSANLRCTAVLMKRYDSEPLFPTATGSQQYRLASRWSFRERKPKAAGVCQTPLDGWRVADDHWRVTDGDCRVTDGDCRVTDDDWRAIDGDWRVTDDDWRVTNDDWTGFLVRIGGEDWGKKQMVFWYKGFFWYLLGCRNPPALYTFALLRVFGAYKHIADLYFFQLGVLKKKCNRYLALNSMRGIQKRTTARFALFFLFGVIENVQQLHLHFFYLGSLKTCNS